MRSWDSMPSVLPEPTPRRFVHLLAPILIAGVLLLLGHRLAACILAVVGLTIYILTLLNRRVQILMGVFARHLSSGVGALMRALLLFPFYILMMAPLALVQRATGKDPLGLDLESKRQSYWTAHSGHAGYERPY